MKYLPKVPYNIFLKWTSILGQDSIVVKVDGCPSEDSQPASFSYHNF